MNMRPLAADGFVLYGLPNSVVRISQEKVLFGIVKNLIRKKQLITTIINQDLPASADDIPLPVKRT